MKNYLLCAVSIAFCEIASKSPQQLAEGIFKAIDTLEKKLPTATESLQFDSSGNPLLTKHDLKKDFQRALDSVRDEIRKRPTLITELGLTRYNNESVIERALRFEKTDTVLAPQKAVFEPLSDMFYVLQGIMTLVAPDKMVYDALKSHADDIAKNRMIDTDETINFIKPVLSGIDAIKDQWLDSSEIAQKIFETFKSFNDFLVPTDDASRYSRKALREILGQLFKNDDADTARFILPWVSEKLGNQWIPFEEISGHKIKNLFDDQSITIPQKISDLFYAITEGLPVDNSLVAILIQKYALRRKAADLHGFQDPLLDDFRNFLISFIRDPAQKIDLIVDGKRNFINPLTHVIDVEDADLLKAVLEKNPQLGHIGAHGTYHQSYATKILKDTENLYAAAKSPEFVLVMANSGITLPSSTEMPVLAQNPVQEKIAELRFVLPLRQLSESFSMLSR